MTMEICQKSFLTMKFSQEGSNSAFLLPGTLHHLRKASLQLLQGDDITYIKRNKALNTSAYTDFLKLQSLRILLFIKPSIVEQKHYLTALLSVGSTETILPSTQCHCHCCCVQYIIIQIMTCNVANPNIP